MRATEIGALLSRIQGRTSSADIWYARIGDHAASIEQINAACLAADERARVGRFRSRAAAERYVLTRALVRTVLGERLHTSATELQLGRTDAGKPTVRGLHFNLSHSGDLIVLAVNERQDVGVDVERRRAVERIEALVKRWLTPEERRDLERETATGAAPSDSFLRIWSQKEARLKALGVGIAGAQHASAHAVECVALEPYLAQLPPGRDGSSYVGALAFA